MVRTSGKLKNIESGAADFLTRFGSRFGLEVGLGLRQCLCPTVENCFLARTICISEKLGPLEDLS